MPCIIRAYQATAPVQPTPRQAPPRQRPIYANFSLYKGKAAASFRVHTKFPQPQECMYESAKSWPWASRLTAACS